MKTKKCIYFPIRVIISIISIFWTSGCSLQEKDIEVFRDEKQSTYSDMIDRNKEMKGELSMLINFNQRLLSDRVQTRWFGRFAATVSADVLGAYGGFQASLWTAAM